MRTRVGVLVLLLCVQIAIAAAFSPEAVRKVDPKILFLLKDPAQFAKGFTNAALGAPVDEGTVVPLVVKTTAPKSRIEALGGVVGSIHGDIMTVRLPLGRVEALASLPEVEAIEASYRLYECLDVSVPECGGTRVRQQLGYTGRGVIVGVLDTGIDPTHPDFLDATNKTRVQFIWDQWSQAGPPPSGFTYGREWTKQQIDAGQCTMTDEGAHGSHCAGIAAGDGSASTSGYIGMAPNADIVVVANLAQDMFTYGYAPPWSNTPSTVGCLDGLAYLYQKKVQLNKPMVINWSQGVAMGPHDGTTLFEQGVDNFISQRNIPVCIAAGNEQQRGWHARVQVPAQGNQGREIPFTTGTPGQDQLSGSVTFEVWYAYGDRMNLEIIDPQGGSTRAFGPDETNWPGWIVSTGDTVWVYSNSNHPVSRKGYFLVTLWDWGNGVTQGTWRVRLTPNNSLPQGGNADLYFERNQYAVRWLDYVSLTGNVGMPASCRNAIAVGSYNTKLQWTDIDGNGYSINETLGEISGFSNWGPTSDGRQKPDISAPGQIVASVLSAGSRNDYLTNQRFFVAPDGVHVYMQGTSMATPHVAGAIALMLEKKPTASVQEIKTALCNTARHDQYTGQGWQPDFGWGKLDAYAAVQALGGGGPGQTVELIYDDGTPSLGYYWIAAGQGSGVRVSPPSYPATIVKLKYYIDDVSLGGTFVARALDFSPTSQTPSTGITTDVTANASAAGWVEVDVSSQQRRVNREFVVGMFYTGSSFPVFGADPQNNGRSWDYDGTSWAAWPETYFMRAIVQVGVGSQEDLQLAGLAARAVEGAVILSWEAVHSWEVVGYHVYRNDEPSTESWTQLNPAPFTGTQFKDATVEPGRRYFYWLEALAPSGVGILYGPVEATTPGGPTTVWLMPPVPTPSRGPVALRFYLPCEGAVSLGLYDVGGRRVASLLQGHQGQGWQTLSWAPAPGLAPGSYVCTLVLEAGGSRLKASTPYILVH